MTHPYLERAPKPRVLAHRGLVLPDEATRVAENSFAAVAAAQAAGATFVESDCHLTRDGEVVLFHDTSLVRVTGDPRAVADVTLRELSDLMSTRGGLITLRQALDAFPGVRFNIDVKSDAAAVPAGRIIEPHADRVLLTSFDDARRRRAVATATGRVGRPATSPGRSTILRLVMAANLGRRRAAERLLADVDALQIPERSGSVPVLTKRLLRWAHEADTEVHVWTVNDPVRMQALVDLGVDGIVTDRADLALDVLG